MEFFSQSARLNIGIQYQKRGSYDAAMRIFHLAAYDNYPPAQHHLGDTYRFGIGVQQDNQRAFMFYRRAACNGFLKSLYKVAWCYQFGVGVSKNLETAFQYYKMAADQEYPVAQFALGCCY